MPVNTSPRDREWRDGEALSFRDRVSIDGDLWDRYIEWGRGTDGDGYFIHVLLDVAW